MKTTKLTNISMLLTLKSAWQKGGRNLSPQDLGALSKASLVYDPQKILWVGRESELPLQYRSLPEHDCKNHVVTPEIVDCHTHLVFGGSRAQEYIMRLNGADYEEIAKSGGGILATVKGTNKLSADQLFTLAQKRCECLYSYGVGTIEIKSGYGLNFAKEYEISHVIYELKKAFAPQIQIHNTFMAAHAVPQEFSSSTEYLNEVVLPLLEKLSSEGIIDSVDIFHEQGYFNDDDVKLLFSKAKSLGLPRRCHADEFNDNKGAILACEHGALSTDHLLRTDSQGLATLAQSQTVATLLPGTGFFLGKDQANARLFFDQGCQVAIGSDYNPGSCHFDNVLQIAAMAAPQYRMNQTELWASITLNAAHALGLKNQGAIVPGLAPRFSFFHAESIDEITYSWGKNFAVIPKVATKLGM